MYVCTVNTLGTQKLEMKLTKYQQDLLKTSQMTGYALNVQQVLKELLPKTNKFSNDSPNF